MSIKRFFSFSLKWIERTSRDVCTRFRMNDSGPGDTGAIRSCRVLYLGRLLEAGLVKFFDPVDNSKRVAGFRRKLFRGQFFFIEMDRFS